MTTKDDNSTPTTDGQSFNAFEAGRQGTAERDRAEAKIEGVRELGGVFVQAVRATRLPMVLTDPALPGEPIVFANQAFLDLSGYAMHEVLGQHPHFMNGPETDGADAGRFLDILRSDRDGLVETVQYAKGGRRFVATVLLSAFKDEAGEMLHHFLSWTDVTRRVDAEDDNASLRATQAALRESEADLQAEPRLATLLRDLSARLVTEESLQAIYEEILTAAIEITGARAGTVQMFDEENEELVVLATRGFSRETDDYFHRVDAGSQTSCGLALRTGTRSYFDFDPADDDPSARLYVQDGVLSAQSTPLLSRSGTPIGMVSSHWGEAGHRMSERELRFIDLLARQAADLIEQRNASAILRESGERLQLIVENARDYAIFTIDPDGLVTGWHEGAEAVFGYSSEEIVGQDGNLLFTPEDRAAGAFEEERAVAAERGKAPDVRWHLRKDGSRVFIDGVSTALRSAEGKLTGFLKVGRDATDRHQAERRQQLLLEELQHRVRNILAMVRSLVRQSNGEGYRDLDDFVAHLVGRLDAIARTQVILTRAADAKVDLEMLVRDELRTQIVDELRLQIAGPAVSLAPKAAEVLTLALHELATNSLKYGALSDPFGRLAVTWAVTARGAEPWLQITWDERSRHDAHRPTAPGFGTELIEERVPYELKGEASLQVTDDGVIAEIAFPLVEGASILETGAVAGA